MKAISIYTITRNQNTEYLQKLERQLSGRDVFLKIREWELSNTKWVDNVKSGAYQSWIEQNYEGRQ